MSVGPESVEIGLNGSHAIRYGGMVIGEWDALSHTLSFDLGWLRLAGVGLHVSGDRTDRKRVALDRPVKAGENGQMAADFHEAEAAEPATK